MKNDIQILNNGDIKTSQQLENLIQKNNTSDTYTKGGTTTNQNCSGDNTNCSNTSDCSDSGNGTCTNTGTCFTDLF